MRRKVFTVDEREFWADKFMDLANLEIIIMVFGQFSAAKILWHVAALGVIIYILIVGFSIQLRRKRA